MPRSVGVETMKEKRQGPLAPHVVRKLLVM